jgi:myxalamid-type polyketide synthase MxaE and MxaD
MGRRGLPPREQWATIPPGSREAEQVAVVRGLEDLGVAVTVVAADVNDPVAMGDLVRRFGGDLPPLRGVVHAAAALGNVSIASMTRPALEEMLRPKVRGTWVLHELTRDLPLDFFVLFSSTTALWGSRDLGHYAAANHFLDAFAHHRQALGLPALTINWGTWDEMRVASSEERDAVARSGLNPMPSDQALQVLGELLASETVQLTVASVDWDRLKAIYEVRRARPFLSLVATPRPARPPGQDQAPSELSARLAATEPDQRRAVVVEFLREAVARALGIQSADAVDADQGLFEMGMDSLMSVELKARIERALDRKLPSTLTFNYPNVNALADFLTADSAVPEPESPVDDGPVTTAVDHDELSEDELAALLTARLAKLP